MNRQIRQLAFALIVLYVVLFGALNYWQINRTDELASEPGNTRAVIREFDKPRGEILTADGVVVARTVPAPAGSDVAFAREYPTADLFAQITGYSTFGLGSTQLEKTQSAVLRGDTPAQQVRALPEVFNGNNDNSGSVRLTLRNDMQNVAKFVLGEREGSIVMTNVKTGAVIAMWSWPSYDPNLIANPDYGEAYDALVALQDDDRDPLLANAYQQRYMPGSTFKVLTTGVGLDDGVLTPETTFEVANEWVPPQTNDPIENYNGKDCGGDLAEAFARSCNIPFAQTAIALGPQRFEEGMTRWGVGQPIPIDLPNPASSTLGDMSDIDQNLPLLAIRGFGQSDDQMVPLHMAMVAAAVANDGVMMKPYVVDATYDHAGQLLTKTEPQPWLTAVSPTTASILTQLMIGVAERGTASCCIALDNAIPVAAKTGTAQLNGPGQPERSHAWIVAFAPADNPQYAVAVMIKGTTDEISASTGGRLAGPLAKAMLDEVFAADARAVPAPTTAPAGGPEPTSPEPGTDGPP